MRPERTADGIGTRTPIERGDILGRRYQGSECLNPGAPRQFREYDSGREARGSLTVESGPTLGDDPVFLRWCRECPEQWAAWQAQWAAELRKGMTK
jgi:hypothetical protein